MRGDYKPLFTEPEATNCFSINFQVFTNNSQLNFIKIIKKQRSKNCESSSKTLNLDKSNQDVGKSIVTCMEIYRC